MGSFAELLRCPICYGSLNEEYRCESCKRSFLKEGIIILNGDLDTDKQKVKNLYDELAKRKSRNPFSRFSTYLNYGIKKDKIECTRFNASNDLVQNVCENLDFTDKRVVDVGCGRGGALFNIRYNFETNVLVGIDISQENIKFCKLRSKDIEFIVGDAENLPFKDEMFDVLINIESAIHYKKSIFFKEVARVLINGGIFIYVDIIDVEDEFYAKKILMEEGLYILEEKDYTRLVINSMKDYLITNQSEEQLFNHFYTYENLRNRKTRYVMWKISKEKK